MGERLGLAARYTLFAVAAILANLAIQRLILMAGETAMMFTLAVGAGTAVGLVIKYVLDKRWIFADDRSGVGYHGRTFGLYSLMGVVTTAVFWCTETAFWLIWGTDLMRETGAVLGLAAGYIIKYRLDRRFVFTPNAREVPV